MRINPRWRGWLPQIDAPLTLAAVGLVAIGLATVFSATWGPSEHQGLWVRQLVWALVAGGAAWLVASIHYRAYDSLAYPIYVLSLVFLGLVLVMGTSAYGARRWMELGPLKFQPSEIAKIATVLVLARRFDDPKRDLRKLRHWFPALALTLVPFALVAKEPDLGTSLSFPVILVVMYFWAGMPIGNLLLGLTPVFNVLLFFTTGTLWWFAGLLAGLLAFTRPRIATLLTVLALNGAVAYAMPHLWNHLADYQKRRIETFLNPDHDPSGAGYQIIQSKIAIGSGGMLGKGFLRGTQKALAFLPMGHTDFIFSVVGEELGFVGVLVALCLFAWMLFGLLRIARRATDPFSSLCVFGIAGLFFTHIFENVGMTINLMPITGIPLPFFSYGGSFLLACSIGVAIALRVAWESRLSGYAELGQ